ncbi:hypothetical protein K439DRAFT_545257 [Ramaria rubella]|nr:hypothetical protein K439DRAFT_545257 [Ramaria rubella]
MLKFLPNIARYVKSLTVINCGPFPERSIPVFSNVLSMFYNVRTLGIYPDMPIPLAAYPIVLKSFPLIQKLALKCCTLEIFRIILPIMGSKQHLERLEVKESRIIDSAPNHTPPLDITPIAVDQCAT